jgi:hypothetical protein
MKGIYRYTKAVLPPRPRYRQNRKRKTAPVNSSSTARSRPEPTSVVHDSDLFDACSEHRPNPSDGVWRDGSPSQKSSDVPAEPAPPLESCAMNNARSVADRSRHVHR